MPLALLLPPFGSELKPFLISFLVAAAAAYPIYQLLLALKSRQTVSQYAPEAHQKKQGTPTMGGIIIAIGFLAVPGSAIVSELIRGRSGHLNQNVCVFGLFLAFAIIGFVDDFVVPRMFVGKRGLGWKQKIVMQFVVAVVCSHFIYGDFSLEFMGMVFLILFFSNAYNFSDGLDALASTLLIGLVAGLIFITFLVREWGLAKYLVALLGAILPFLYLNKPKAKLFMGDVGSLPIGAVLGLVVAYLAYPRGAFHANEYEGHWVSQLTRGSGWVLNALCLFIISGMMIIELVPVPLQILSVKLRKKKLFSFTPIHHAFEREGWPEGKVVAVFATCQVALSFIAVVIAYYGAKPGEAQYLPVEVLSSSATRER